MKVVLLRRKTIPFYRQNRLCFLERFDRRKMALETVLPALLTLVLVGCSGDTDGASNASTSAQPSNQTQVLSSICDNTALFSNNTEQSFVITKIVRENKSYDAHLKVGEDYIWKFKGYQHSKISHTPPRKLVVNAKEDVVCHHHGYQLTVFGHYAPLK